MSWLLETARARVGMAAGDASQDSALLAAMDVALAAAEGYCDRKFLLADDTEAFNGPHGGALTVRRYPLVSLTSMLPLPPLAVPPPDPAAIPLNWSMDARKGIVYIGSSWRVAAGDVGPVLSCRSGFELSYVGGFPEDELPHDLEAALWMAFDSVWTSTPGWGLPAGSGAAGGPVRSFGIDGMSMTYESASSGVGGAGRAPGAWGLLPATAVGILNFYRSESAALGA